MPESLDNARAMVRQMIESGQVPQELIGDIDLESLTDLVSDLVEEAIKRNLSPAMENETVTEALITGVMESVANQAALIGILAAISEISDEPAEADYTLSVPADDVADLVASLLRGKGVTIALNVANERT